MKIKICLIEKICLKKLHIMAPLAPYYINYIANIDICNDQMIFAMINFKCNDQFQMIK